MAITANVCAALGVRTIAQLVMERQLKVEQQKLWKTPPTNTDKNEHIPSVLANFEKQCSLLPIRTYSNFVKILCFFMRTRYSSCIRVCLMRTKLTELNNLKLHWAST